MVLRRLGRLDGRSAEGTRGVGLEPHVYALDVEAVATLREESGLLALLELGQADGALERLTAALVGVGEDGEGLEDGGVEATGGGGGIDVEDEVSAAVVTV